jgi:hypothetical protein
MSERKRVIVNEAAMQEIIANDKQEYLIKPFVKEPELLIIKQIEPEPEPEQKPEPVPEPAKVETPSSENDQSKAQKKRKSQKSDFVELFLKERVVKNRKPIYISVET